MKPCLLFWFITFFPGSVLGQAIASTVYVWDKASVVRGATGYEERTLLDGETHGFSNVTVQAITLGGNQPAQPDQQLDEEAVLVVKEGRLTITLGQKQRELGPGSVVLLMPGDFFKLENKTNQPLTYYQVRLTSNEVPDLDLYRLMGQSFWIDWQEKAATSAERGEVAAVRRGNADDKTYAVVRNGAQPGRTQSHSPGSSGNRTADHVK